jgi:hypothetical protein
LVTRFPAAECKAIYVAEMQVVLRNKSCFHSQDLEKALVKIGSTEKPLLLNSQFTI